MAEGKFFTLSSNMNGFLLGIADNSANHDQPVKVYAATDHVENTFIWYEDHANCRIRSKADDTLCLEVKGDHLVVAKFDLANKEQRWKVRADGHVYRADAQTQVLDIADWCKDSGARVCTWQQNGGANQTWTPHYLPPKFCYIVSKLHGRVLEVREDGDKPRKVMMMKKRDGRVDHQLWWEDKVGVIRSKLSDLALDPSEGSFRLIEYDLGIDIRNWVRSGEKIVNRIQRDLCMEIKAGEKKKGAKLSTCAYGGQEHQQWDFEYI